MGTRWFFGCAAVLGLLSGEIARTVLPLVALLGALGIAHRTTAGKVLATLCLFASIGSLAPGVEGAFVEGPVRGWVRWSPGLSPDAVRVDLQGTRSRRKTEERVWLRLPPDLVPELGDRSLLRLRGLLRPPSRFANRGENSLPGDPSLVVKSRRLVEVVDPGSAGVSALREGLAESIPRLRCEGVLRAVLLGDTSRLQDFDRRLFRRYGLAHLLAVSGLHVGLVASGLLLMGRARGSKWGFWLPLVGVVVYAVLVGGRPSALRAATMLSLLLLGRALLRATRGRHLLVVAGMGLLAVLPGLLRDPGFQLSVLATAAILELSPLWMRSWTWIPEGIRGTLAVGVAAQVGTLPIVLPWMGRVHPEGILLQWLAVPWLLGALLGGGGALALELAGGWAPWTLVDGWVSAPLVLLEGWPPGALYAVGSWTTLGAFGAAAAVTVVLSQPRLSRWFPLLLLQCVPGSGQELPASLEVLDVGQGDAVLLSSKDGHALVDAGGWRRGDFAGRVLLPALADRGIRTLDVVIVTHGDVDHCGGALQLIQEMAVDEVWAPPAVASTACGAALLRRPGPRWRPVWAGDVLETAGWRFDVLAPEPGTADAGNDGSLVLLASPVGRAGGRTVLLTGDIERRAEQALIRRWGGRLEAEILKVAHHGSRTSTSEAWLKSVRPRLALWSAGRPSPFGHPAREVLERLDGRGIPHLGTARAGAIRLEAGPSGWRLETPWNPP